MGYLSEVQSRGLNDQFESILHNYIRRNFETVSDRIRRVVDEFGFRSRQYLKLVSDLDDNLDLRPGFDKAMSEEISLKITPVPAALPTLSSPKSFENQGEDSMGNMTEIAAAGLQTELEGLLTTNVADEAVREQIKSTLDASGLKGKEIWTLVNELHQQNKVNPGLYAQLVQLNDKFLKFKRGTTSTGTATPRKGVARKREFEFAGPSGRQWKIAEVPAKGQDIIKPWPTGFWEGGNGAKFHEFLSATPRTWEEVKQFREANKIKDTWSNWFLTMYRSGSYLRHGYTLEEMPDGKVQIMYNDPTDANWKYAGDLQELVKLAS